MAEQLLDTGSPLDTEFNKMLTSDMPLVDVVRHWERTVLPVVDSLRTAQALEVLPHIECIAYNLTMYGDWDTYVINPARADFNYLSKDRAVRDYWTKLENARVALRQVASERDEDVS